MGIISICAVAIVATVLSLTLRRYNQELSLLVSIGAGIVLLLSTIQYVLKSIESVSSLLAAANIKADYIVILLKVMGICFVTEFTCDCTKEAGYDSISSNIALCGKVLVLFTATPMFMNVVDVVTSLCTGDAVG